MPQSTPAVSAQLAPVLACAEANTDDALKRLFELLRIPSISTDPEYREQTRAAAQWLVDELAGLGFEASLRTTPGHPMVVAHHPGPGDGPRILYYGHYDVQPPDPLEKWTSPPFEPTLADGPAGKRIVARGACDDKGQLMTFVEAFRAWLQTHETLPVAVTVLLEGEEESGSPSLEGFLNEHREELRADACVVCDTGMWNADTPAITSMLRGLVYMEVTLHGPAHDLHSGMYGGAVVNPLNALGRVLGELVDDRGRVQIPGFYDDVAEVPPDQRQRWAELGFDERGFLESAGLESSTGEQGYSILERLWCRPTCDVNGIWGGYTGRGAKTVIAAHASAKVSCRLVARQDPQRIVKAFKSFFEQRTPPGCRWSFQQHGASAAIAVPTDSPWLAAASQGLKDVYETDPLLMGCGGSIPVVGSFQAILGIDSLLVGFALDDDRIHSPNEKYELKSFTNGIASHAAIMARLAERSGV